MKYLGIWFILGFPLKDHIRLFSDNDVVIGYKALYHSRLLKRAIFNEFVII